MAGNTSTDDDDSGLSGIAIGFLVGGSILFVIILVLFIVWLLKINGKICYKTKQPRGLPPVIHDLNMAGILFENDEGRQSSADIDVEGGDGKDQPESRSNGQGHLAGSGDPHLRAKEAGSIHGRSHFNVYTKANPSDPYNHVGTFKKDDTGTDPQQRLQLLRDSSSRDSNHVYNVATDDTDSNANVKTNLKTPDNTEYSLAKQINRNSNTYFELESETDKPKEDSSTEGGKEGKQNKGENERPIDDVQGQNLSNTEYLLAKNTGRDSNTYFELESESNRIAEESSTDKENEGELKAGNNDASNDGAQGQDLYVELEDDRDIEIAIVVENQPAESEVQLRAVERAAVTVGNFTDNERDHVTRVEQGNTDYFVLEKSADNNDAATDTAASAEYSAANANEDVGNKMADSTSENESVENNYFVLEEGPSSGGVASAEKEIGEDIIEQSPTIYNNPGEESSTDGLFAYNVGV